MKKVAFKITQLVDPIKQGSELEVDKTFIGQLSHNEKKIYYSDVVGTDWIFYIDDTCVLILLWGQNKYNQKIYQGDKLQNADGSTFYAEFDYDNSLWIKENKYFNAFKLD